MTCLVHIFNVVSMDDELRKCKRTIRSEHVYLNRFHFKFFITIVDIFLFEIHPKSAS